KIIKRICRVRNDGDINGLSAKCKSVYTTIHIVGNHAMLAAVDRSPPAAEGSTHSLHRTSLGGDIYGLSAKCKSVYTTIRNVGNHTMLTADDRSPPAAEGSTHSLHRTSLSTPLQLHLTRHPI
ncbi:hypothetical protein J6590_026763, partial [Homalodisca vitripennis]